MTLRRALLVAFAIVALLTTMLWIYVPIVPHSILGWGVLIVLGLPVSLFIEWMGEAVVRPVFFNRMSSPVRVLVMVPVALGLGAIALALVWVVKVAVLTA